MKKIYAAMVISLLQVNTVLASQAQNTVERGTGLLGALGELAWLAAFVFGIVFLIQGIRALVKYSNNPAQAEQQGGLLKPMLYTIGGAALAGFTVWTGFIQDLLLGDDESSSIDRFET